MKLLCVILLSIHLYYAFAHEHTHHHHHDNEPPHLKYTRELNEETLREQEGEEEHIHSHSHGGCPHAKHNERTSRLASTLPKIPNVVTHEHKHFNENGWFAFLNNPQIRLWSYSIGSTLLISALPCLILAFIPINSDANGESPLLRTLLAFGAGGLLGDAFLHLIPHATPDGGHAHSHSHSHESGDAHTPHDLSVGTWVLIGFITFFIVEKVVRILRNEKSTNNKHGHSHGIRKLSTEKLKNSDEDSDGNTEISNKMPKAAKISSIRITAYLNLVADFMHNFTDGLAIGASFISGTTIGIVTMITVLVHEIPHEIGDFAILVKSGFSKKKAMLIQLYTAFGALAGCSLAIWDVDAANLAEAVEHSWALPFTAGGFIYIGTVSLIPELLENSTIWESVKELVAFFLGLFMMYVIAFFE